MSPRALRLCAIAGFLAVALVISFGIVGPQIVAGQRVSGTQDSAAIRGYYAHSALATMQAGIFPAALSILILAVGLHSISPQRSLSAKIGLAIVSAIVPGYLLSASLQVALVSAAQAGGEVLGLFRLWDAFYNSALYTLESGYVIAFTLALTQTSVFPRWFRPFGLIVGVLQAVNCCALWIGLPDTATIPGNVGMLSWLFIASMLLFGAAKHGRFDHEE